MLALYGSVAIDREYCQSCQAVNFVAACGTCNRIKGPLMFANPEEAIGYVWRKRVRKGWTSATEEAPDSALRDLWRGVPDSARR